MATKPKTEKKEVEGFASKAEVSALTKNLEKLTDIMVGFSDKFAHIEEQLTRKGVVKHEVDQTAARIKELESEIEQAYAEKRGRDAVKLEDELEALQGSRPSETADAKSVRTAGPEKFTVNPEWDELAKEILGKFLDHTEVRHERTGGIKFTIVVKSQYSNAGEDYLRMYKADRRTVDVGGTGFEGVREWCTRVLKNLQRPRNTAD